MCIRGRIKREDLLRELEKAGLEPCSHNLALTGNFYVKFKCKELRSLRMGDYPGRQKYAYKWNLRSDIEENHTEIDRGCTRFYYRTDNLKEMIEHMINYKNKIETYNT